MTMKHKVSPRNRRRNPVARHACKVNRCIAFRDRTRYDRTAKHRSLESFPKIAVSQRLGKLPDGFSSFVVRPGDHG